MAEASVESNETIVKNDNENKSTAQYKETEDASQKDELSKSENDSATSESILKNTNAKSNVASNLASSDGGSDGEKTNGGKEELNESLNKEEPSVNSEQQESGKESTVDTTTTTAVEVSSTESTEDAKNQKNVEQTQQQENDKPSQVDTNIDNKDTSTNNTTTVVPVTPVNIQSEAIANENSDIIATKTDDNRANSDVKPDTDKSDEVASSGTENKGQESEKTTGESRESNEGEKPTETNIELEKDDTKHESVDNTAKIETQGDSGTTNELKEQSGVIEATNTLEDTSKPNISPSSTEKAVTENLPETAPKPESVVPNEKTEGKGNISKDNGEVKEVVSDSENEKRSEVPANKEPREEATKTERNEGKDGNVKTSENAEISGNSGDTVKDVVKDVVIDVESNETQQDSVKEFGKDTGNKPEVSKDQNNTEQIKQENIENPKDETREKEIESKATSEIQNSEVSQVKRQTENATDESTKANANEITPNTTETEPEGSKDDKTSTADTEHGTVKDKPNETTSRAEVCGEDAASEVNNDDVCPSLNETATEAGKSDQAKSHNSEVGDVVKETTANKTDISENKKGQDKGKTGEAISDAKEGLPEQNLLTDTTNQQEGIQLVENKEQASESTAVDNKEKIEEAGVVKVDGGDSKSAEDTLSFNDKPINIEIPMATVDQSGDKTITDEPQDIIDASEKTVLHSGVAETVGSEDQTGQVEESVKSKPESEGTETTLESNQDWEKTANQLDGQKEVDETKDTGKSKESKNESDSTRPALDKDNIVESSPQGSSDEEKIMELKGQTMESKVETDDPKATVDQASDNTTVKSVDQGGDVESTKTSKDQDTEPETKVVDQSDDKEIATETKDNGEKGAAITGVSEDKRNSAQNVGESKVKALETETSGESKGQNRDEETAIQSKDESLDSEKSTKDSDESKDVLPATETKDPSTNTGTTVESKAEDDATVKESKDLVADNKTTVKMDESSEATVTAESKDQNDDATNSNDNSEMSTLSERPEPGSQDTTEASSAPTTEQPKQSSEGKKLKEKKSTFGNPLSVLGISMGTKQETMTEPKKIKSKNKCDVIKQKDKDDSAKAQEVPLPSEVSKDATELKIVEKPTETTENQNVNDGKEEEDYVMIDHEDAKTEGSINESDLHDPISQDDKSEKDDVQKSVVEINEGDFGESVRDDVRDEERPGEEEAKASHMTTVPLAVPTERPVVEITADFLELMEGFCMAASQEFPSDIIDFACRYFQRIYKRRNALRKYSIEVSDLALFSDVNWIGNI